MGSFHIWFVSGQLFRGAKDGRLETKLAADMFNERPLDSIGNVLAVPCEQKIETMARGNGDMQRVRRLLDQMFGQCFQLFCA